jgi:hypothetical protein
VALIPGSWFIKPLIVFVASMLTVDQTMSSNKGTPYSSPESLSSYRTSLSRKMQERFQDALKKLEDANDDDVRTRLEFREELKRVERNPLENWVKNQAIHCNNRNHEGPVEGMALDTHLSGARTATSEASFTGLESFPFTPPLLKQGESSCSGSVCRSMEPRRVPGSPLTVGSQVDDVSVELARGVKIMKAEIRKVSRPVIHLRRKSTDAATVFGRVDALGAELATMLGDAALRPVRPLAFDVHQHS